MKLGFSGYETLLHKTMAQHGTSMTPKPGPEVPAGALESAAESSGQDRIESQSEFRQSEAIFAQLVIQFGLQAFSVRDANITEI